MAIATATSLDVYVGGKLLFEEVGFKLEPRERMTLSGRNGAGKSTLLRVLAGELAPDAGSLTVQRGARVALHDQRPPRESEATLGEYVFSGRSDMLETEAELERLEGQMGGEVAEETMRAYSAAQQRLEAGGGYRWRDDVLAVLRGLGFDSEQAERRLSTFSGGELTRASLARSLAARPDLLLLDEPTNHLDIPSLEWLERYLVDLDAAVVLVAHDRWFLEAVGTSVLELEAGRARFFAGPWHAWRKEQAKRAMALGKAIERQQAEIARMERFVERFRYKATKARQAQSRVKHDREIQARRAGRRKARRPAACASHFKPPERPGRVVLKLVSGRLEVPGRVLLDKANLEIERGEHVVLVGPNGAGKTTLIETLAGQREPASGSVRNGHNVKLGYLSQHAETAAGSGSVLDAAKRETGLTENKARALLGGFLFSGADVEKQLSDISGGEQRRLSLAILVASGANVLVLDEPTNHLDIESREALEDALTEFEGTVLLVSHDRALLEAVGSRTLVCEDGRLKSHQSGWAEYQLRRDEEATEESAAKPRAGGGKKYSATRPAQKAARKAAKLEQRIERAEAKLHKLEDELADPAAWSSPGRIERATKRHEEAKAEVEGLYARVGGGSGCGGGRRVVSVRARQRPLEHDPGPVLRGEGDVADLDLFRGGVGRPQGGTGDEFAEDDPHLELGEGSADAAPDAAAERDPGVGVGFALEEALGPELLRVGVDVLAQVDGGDRRHHEAARGQAVAADRRRRSQPAGDVDDHRPRPQRLFYRRLEVVASPAPGTPAAAPAPAGCAAAARSPRRGRSRWSRGRRRRR